MNYRIRLLLIAGVLGLNACGPAPEQAAQPADVPPQPAEPEQSVPEQIPAPPGHGSGELEAAAPDVPRVSGTDLLAQISSGKAPLILDVRRPDEYAAGHIPGAVNIPHTEIGARMSELGDDPNQEIIVHCRSGKRAGMAEAELIAAGYTQVRHLEGDMLGWQAAGLPVDGQPVDTESTP